MLKIRKKMGKKGLTLIELLVTIAVLAVVAAIAVPAVTNVVESTNERAIAQTETDIANFTEKYSKTGSYTYDPSTGIFAGYADLDGDGVATEDEKIEEFNVDLDKFSVGSVGEDVPTSAAGIDFDNPVATNFSIIDYTVTLTPESLTISGYVNNAIEATNVSLDGAQGAITWTVTEGTLPTGLSLNPSTGIVTGTPTDTYTLDTVVIQATDENGASITQSHSYDIAPEPTQAQNADWSDDGSRIVAVYNNEATKSYTIFGIAVTEAELAQAGPWKYSMGGGSGSAFSNSDTTAVLETPVSVQGTTYTHVIYSSNWTTGNPNYDQFIEINGVTYNSGGEVDARNRNLYGDFR